MSINPNDLRALADFLDEHPTLRATINAPTIYAFTYDVDEWRQILADLGTYEKGADNYDLEATRSFGEARIKVCIPKTKTCERVQVAEREVEVPVYPDDVEPTLKKVTEPVYEWKCPDSWLRDEQAHVGQLVEAKAAG